MTSKRENWHKSLKEVPITDVLLLINEVRKLALETIKESKYANQSFAVLRGVLVASSAITKDDIELPWIVVDVPSEIKEQLNDIQWRVTSQDLLLASLQGMMITQATLWHQSQSTFAQPSAAYDYQSAAAWGYQQCSNTSQPSIFDELVESLNLMLRSQNQRWEIIVSELFQTRKYCVIDYLLKLRFPMFDAASKSKSSDLYFSQIFCKHKITIMRQQHAVTQTLTRSVYCLNGEVA